VSLDIPLIGEENNVGGVVALSAPELEESRWWLHIVPTLK